MKMCHIRYTNTNILTLNKQDKLLLEIDIMANFLKTQIKVWMSAHYITDLHGSPS